MSKKEYAHDFKIGDTVRCKEDCVSADVGPVKGEEFVLTSVSPNYLGFPLLRLKQHSLSVRNGNEANWAHECFEPVKHVTNEVEILINEANVGRRALDRLFEICPEKMEIKNATQGTEWRALKTIQHITYRLKPRVLVPSWTTSTGWRVTYADPSRSVDNKAVTIGCKQFDQQALLKDLIQILDNNRAHGKEYSLIPTRKGVRFEDHILLWADAERILSELKVLNK